MNPPFSKDHLLKEISRGYPLEFTFFWGHQKAKTGELTKSCFSQWWDSPFQLGEHFYRTAEHYMMVHKALLFDDIKSSETILAAATPKEAKHLGRLIKGFDEKIWLQHREEIVYRANLAKFSQHKPLQTFLLDTGEEVLVEASPVDAIWGIGLAADDPKARNPALWPGLNLLGFALMRVRAELAGNKK
jgi:ribA/ribD-fused uncharacterized protein